jgi:hypothetical protein
MELAIVLAIAASFCTATSSVCQRLGARALERGTAQARGFDLLLVFRLARQPVWVLGVTAMIAGFLLQVSALRLGPLALVQPILAVELLFAFGYLVLLRDSRGAGWRDWLAAAAIALASGVRRRGACARGGRATPAGGGSAWRAACLGIGAGIAWGYVEVLGLLVLVLVLGAWLLSGSDLLKSESPGNLA